MTLDLHLRNTEEARVLLGPLDRTAKLLRRVYGVQILHRGDLLRVLGEEEAVAQVRAVLERALGSLRRGQTVSHTDIERWVEGGPTGEPVVDAAPEVAAPPAETVAGVHPRSEGQRHYLRAIDKHSVVFCVGPAGTGKTYLAVAAAVAALRGGQYKRLVLARPAVEAGEKLGFLPGDFQAKVNPYLRPLYDALAGILDPTMTRRYIENDVVEVCPLAYMRGRTLNHAFIILDEAQNTTIAQMRMFLTRMGEHSQVVVTGDLTQIDLPQGVPSGLVDAVERLDRVTGLTVVRLGREDIVRHPIVQRIVEAYEDSRGRPATGEGRGGRRGRGRPPG